MIYKLLLCLLLCSVSFAEMQIEGEEVKEPELLSATLDWEVGKPIRLEISDGRVAEVQIFSRTKVELVTDFNITENLCTGKINTACQLESQADMHNVKAVWIEHSDQNKVGELVYVNNNEIENTVFINFHDRHFKYKKTDVENPRLLCEDFAWLDENLQMINAQTGISDEQIKFLSWDLERNQDNEETGINENRFVLGYMGISLQEEVSQNFGQRSLVWEEVDHFYAESGFFFRFPPFLLAQASTIVKENSEGEVCTINLQPDNSKIFASLQNENLDEAEFKTFTATSQEEFDRVTTSLFSLNPEVIERFNSFANENYADPLAQQMEMIK